jgi:hypothetical protein
MVPYHQHDNGQRGHGRLADAPWSAMATSNCSAAAWQQRGRAPRNHFESHRTLVVQRRAEVEVTPRRMAIPLQRTNNGEIPTTPMIPALEAPTPKSYGSWRSHKSHHPRISGPGRRSHRRRVTRSQPNLCRHPTLPLVIGSAMTWVPGRGLGLIGGESEAVPLHAPAEETAWPRTAQSSGCRPLRVCHATGSVGI